MSAVDLARLVKPLKWTEVKTFGGLCLDASGLYEYRIIHRHGGHWLNATDRFYGHGGPEAAQAAANADHAARVIAALDGELLGALVADFQECLERMESDRASGDCGFWDWPEDCAYTRGVSTLAKLGVQP